MASPTLTIVLVSPHGAAKVAVEAAVRHALPLESLVAVATAAEALVQADSSRMIGRAAGVFVFDFRGRPVGDLAKAVKQVRRAHPLAELVVLADAADGSVFAACLQVTGTPDKLTFLLSPLQRETTIETVRALAERYRATEIARRSSTAASSVAGALEFEIQELRARLDIAKHAARHDDLTGALNRVGFVEELTARLTKGRVSQNVLMIDLDRFKAVNDTLGHSAGDELVRKICTGIQGVLPSDATLARLGGDDFGVILEAGADARTATICSHILKGLLPNSLHHGS